MCLLEKLSLSSDFLSDTIHPCSWKSDGHTSCCSQALPSTELPASNPGERCRRLNKPFPCECLSWAGVTWQAGARAPCRWKGARWGRIAASFVQSSLVLGVCGFRGLGNPREKKTPYKQRGEKGLEKERKIFLKLCNVRPWVMNLHNPI